MPSIEFLRLQLAAPRQILTCLFFLIYFFLPQTPASASPHSPAPLASPVFEDSTLGKPLRVLSWNIYMLPRFALITGKRQRAHIIADELKHSEYNILVFQEAFLGDSRRIIRNGLKETFPYEYGPANRKFSFKTNSGIWVLSKTPLRPLDEIEFSECEGFADCFARKGALLLEGEHQGVTFQIMGTHLQAAGEQAVRDSQYHEIRDMLDRHGRRGVPQLVCGDMNTAKDHPEYYDKMIHTIGAEDGELELLVDAVEKGYPNDMNKWGFRKFRIIDYVFYRGNDHKPAKIRRTMPCFRRPWTRKHQDLSDHFPIDFSVWL